MPTTDEASLPPSRLDQYKRQLDENGFAVIPDAIPPTLVDRLNDRIDELFEMEGDQAGAEFKREPGCQRLANLVNKGDVFQKAVVYPMTLPLVSTVLGPRFKLSSLNVRSVNAGHDFRQPLHADMAAIPDEQGFWVCNVVWMLQDITLDNGPLRVVPGSHRLGRLPQSMMADPTRDHPEQVLLTGARGTIVVFNAHLWHGGMGNPSSLPRRAMHAFYCRLDKPQQQYQKRLIDPAVQSTLSPKLRAMLALDDPRNDRLSERVTTTSGFMK